MKYINSDCENEYYLENFNGFEVRIIKNILTGEVCFHSEDVAKSLGYKSLNEMLISDKEIMNRYLDALNEGKIVTVNKIIQNFEK